MCRAENLEHYFCSEQWTDKHRPGKSKINEVVVYHLDASEIDRPLVEPKYDTLTGGKERFAFHYPAPYMQTTCRQLQTLADTLTFCTERVWGRPPGYVTLWDPKKHFSEENFSRGGLGPNPHYAYLTYPRLYIGLTLV